MAYEDPRWELFLRRPWKCAACDEEHRGLFHLSIEQPFHWDPLSPPMSADQNTFLNQDMCVIEAKDFFVRGVLEIPLIGAGNERFGYGVWTTLAEPNFRRYVDTYESHSQGSLGTWFGWFANRLDGYPDTLNLKCNVRPRDDRQRPIIEVQASVDHPLAREQREGITYDRLMEILALHGHGPPAARHH
jgi:hypothetical protein